MKSIRVMKRVGLVLVAVSAAVGCTSGGFGEGSRTPTVRGGEPSRGTTPGVTAEETGEVVRVRWDRDPEFRKKYPNMRAAQSARYEVQHSTTGAWAGEERVLTRQMSRRPAQSMARYYSEGTQTSVPPLEMQEDYGREEFIHHAPVRGMNYYRYREVTWRGGRVVAEGAWSGTARVNYSGA
ncbi:MAG: hypothetical protein ACF8LK_00490, partial [Phycisphaerales bacterium JB041]